MKGERAMSQRTMRADWETPAGIFDPLNAEFGFTMDAAANSENSKCGERFLGPQSAYAEDGISADWSREVVWLNPPYGHRNLWGWMKKAYLESRHATVVCLVPSHTGQVWWHDWVIDKASEIRWIKGKIKFVGAQSCAPFPSCIVIYRPSAGHPLGEKP